MQVFKRDGSIEPLDLEKIHTMVFRACEGVDDVSPSLVVMNSKIQLTDGIATEYIQNLLVTSANNLITIEEPNYQYVAARLLLFGLYKSLYPQWKTFGLVHIYHHITRFKNKYDSILFDSYSKEDWDVLNEAIDHSKDYKFTYASLQQLIDKYLIQDRSTGFVYEIPQYAYMLIAATVFHDYPVETRLATVIDYYHAISDHEINLPTPIMSGVRTKQRNFSSCFPAGQLVHTSTGLKPIETISVGNMVLTHAGRMMSVLATNAKYFEQKYVAIDTYSTLNDQFVSTDDHLIFAAKDVGCIRGSEHRSCICSQGIYKYCEKYPRQYSEDCINLYKNDLFEPKWTPAKELDDNYWVHVAYNKSVVNTEYLIISDIIDIGSRYDINEEGLIHYKSYRSDIWYVPNKIYLNEELFRLIGYYLAEGHATDGGSMGFTFGNKDKYIIDDCVNIIQNVFGYTVIPSNNPYDNSTKVSICSKIITNLFIRLCSNKFDKKFICYELMNASIELQKQLLIGVIRGDGCAYSQGLQVGLSNKQLIYQLFDISLRLKLSPTINVQKYNDGIRQDVYTIYFPRSANYDFIMEVGKDVHKVNYTSKTYAYGIWKDDNYFTKIKSVKIINSIDDNIVYDLQIAGDESFVVSGLSVHNCALLDCDDSTLSISANNQATAMLTAASSGIGLNVGRMRSIGSSIRNGTVIHPGIVPFLKIFESTGKAFSQAARGGKLTCYYHIFGYEIETVIQLKNNRANEVSSVKHLDYCICISELFYKRFINNQNITLFCNSDTPGLYDAFGTPAFDKLYEYYEKKDGVRKKVVSMQKLFVDLMEQRSETARIYIMNVDHANTHSPYLDGVYMSNLCVAPETLLLTNKGYLPIGTLEDQSVTIWNGWEWSDTVVRKTGIDQKLINIKFQDDKGNIHNIECTEYHKFFIQSRNDVIEVRANDLIVGQYIQNWNPPEFLIDSDITLHQYHRDWWVYSTHNIERLSDTYCLTEPKRNRMVINGILSGQCVEIIQPSHPISDINDTGIHEHTVAVKNNKLDEFIKLSQDNEFLEFPI